MAQLLLWSDAEVCEKPVRKARAVKVPPVCGKCSKAVPPKLRSVMPLDHAVETVRGILIDRLDSGLERLERIALRVACGHIDDAGVAMQLAIEFIQETQVLFFPDEFNDGEPYTPDANERRNERRELHWRDIRIINDDGTTEIRNMAEWVNVAAPAVLSPLVPRLPTMAIYARHLLEKGKSSPAVASLPGVFTDAELARLGERMERREQRSA